MKLLLMLDSWDHPQLLPVAAFDGDLATTVPRSLSLESSVWYCSAKWSRPFPEGLEVVTPLGHQILPSL